MNTKQRLSPNGAPVCGAYWMSEGVLVVYLDKTQEIFPPTKAMQDLASEHFAWTKKVSQAMDAARWEDALL